MSDKEFDKQFRNKFESFEINPSSLVWDEISNNLAGSKKKQLFPVIWMAAASVIAVLATGWWLLPAKEPLKLQGKVVKQTPVTSKETENSTPLTIKPIHVHKDKAQNISVVKVQTVKPTVHKKVKVRAPSPNLNNEVILAYNNNNEDVVNSNNADLTEASMSVQNNSLLTLQEEKSENEMHLKPKSKIKTVGDLVNFVVRKVDKRKNKLIEFSKEDEGEIVSGLNLGLLQYKTKAN